RRAAVTGTQRAHLMLDAWVFVAIADAMDEPISRLANVLGSADAYNHDIPRAREIEHAVRDLSRAGLVQADGLSPMLTSKGRGMWNAITEREHLMDRRLEYAEQLLRDVRCVAT